MKKELKHLKTFEQNTDKNLNISDVIDSKINRSREEVIELLSNSSNFEEKELIRMTNDELLELWDSLEMDDWLDELENEN
jgi:hypothetical protein